MCSETISLADLADGIIVEPYMESLLNPTAIDEVKLLEYIPYARRRITEVLFPTSNVGKPAYLSQLCCVMTVPSPWTEAEGWRRSPLAGTGRRLDWPFFGRHGSQRPMGTLWHRIGRGG
jgi:hypothetical protein